MGSVHALMHPGCSYDAFLPRAPLRDVASAGPLLAGRWTQVGLKMGP